MRRRRRRREGGRDEELHTAAASASQLPPHPPSRGLAVAGQNAWQALVEAAVADHASLLDVRKVVGSLAVSTFGGGGERQGGKSLG